MRKIYVVVLFLCCMGLASIGYGASEDYRLGPGDVLAISVWGYEELQAEALAIRPDGKIAIPLVGEVQAAGMTPHELSVALTTALMQYVKEPKVTVNVVEFRTTRVYVLGEVGKPGLYELDKGYRVLDAVSAAGGFARSAAIRKVYLVRNGQENQYTLIDLNKMLRKGDMGQNYLLGEGDVIFLARNTLDYVKDILPFITAAYQIDDLTSN